MQFRKRKTDPGATASTGAMVPPNEVQASTPVVAEVRQLNYSNTDLSRTEPQAQQEPDNETGVPVTAHCEQTDLGLRPVAQTDAPTTFVINDEKQAKPTGAAAFIAHDSRRSR